ncbi:MAG TPA: hypothetical protein VFP40_20230 [Terriglobales bacterium]|nr:hypothetical protein [Terriglobales bacterium]
MLHKKILCLSLIALLLCAVAVAQVSTIPNGTEIKVRTDTAVVATPANAGRRYDATVSEPVNDANGRTVIPKGARAQLTAIKDGSKVALDLTSVNVDGRRYSIASSSYKEGSVGANKTTAKYAGGGALAGTLIGAVAGGAKGAVIGALAGGAAGAGAQVLTKGKKINIPAETELTFKTASDLQLRAVASGTRRR